jgi:hypothetical protein
MRRTDFAKRIAFAPLRARPTKWAELIGRIDSVSDALRALLRHRRSERSQTANLAGGSHSPSRVPQWSARAHPEDHGISLFLADHTARRDLFIAGALLRTSASFVNCHMS